MTTLSHVRLAALFGVLLLVLAFAGCGNVSRGVPPAEGILNFGRVNETFFRGAQPDEAGIANLSRLGVRTMINLRLRSDTLAGEEAAARSHGIGYVSEPFQGMGAPTDAQVAKVLALIDSSPSPVFVHCEHGADRTGMIVACYRQRHDHWRAERALAEAKDYGFSLFQVGMRRYIKAFSPAPPR